MYVFIYRFVGMSSFIYNKSYRLCIYKSRQVIDEIPFHLKLAAPQKLSLWKVFRALIPLCLEFFT